MSKRNSTNNASWGGPQHREIGSPIPTDNESWRGPNIEKLEPQFLQTKQVGVGSQHRSWRKVSLQ
ncbi:hypothetical protein C7P91_11235 [Staphylococcus aureus]|nr:hypothetical protein C7Q20_09170 [Staphylococcus aureus]PZK46131.1 hypothetical protein C7Q47_06280 [Staphylococcus aureus]PZK56569.1 hypothetical protein C7Q50_14260 [Staphylococcus aureus]PZL50898.1 hypothetical protein C7P91_11235 [Staphylococcus aureus]QFK03935.1 hypothetical protein DQV87_05790 [Staphylococcus aureus]